MIVLRSDVIKDYFWKIGSDDRPHHLSIVSEDKIFHSTKRLGKKAIIQDGLKMTVAFF